MTVSKERKAELELARYYRRRTQAVELLGGECSVCNSKEQLEFDHKDPASKSFPISRLWSISWERFLHELDKCQLLCHDCHSAKTYDPRRDSRRHGTHAMYSRGKCRCQVCRDFFNAYRRELRRRQ